MKILLTLMLLSMVCYGFEVRENTVPLNNDGIIQQPLANCSPDGRIDIQSSRYLMSRCPFDGDCQTDHGEPLNSAAELILHQKCSWQIKCGKLSFPPISTDQTKRINSVNIKYRCSSETDTFINMCVNREVTFRNKLHITIDKSVTNFESCECFVNQGYFSVSINDARLIDEKDNKCLPAKLFINSRQIYCNASRDDFGSVFHERVIKSASSAFISIKMNSGSEAPAMIMLSVNPQEYARIICEGKGLWSPSQPSVTKLSSTGNTSEITTTTPTTTVRSQKTSVAKINTTTTFPMNTDVLQCQRDKIWLNAGNDVLVIIVISLIVIIIIMAKYDKFPWFQRCRNSLPPRSKSSTSVRNSEEPSVSKAENETQQPDESYDPLLNDDFIDVANRKDESTERKQTKDLPDPSLPTYK